MHWFTYFLIGSSMFAVVWFLTSAIDNLPDQQWKAVRHFQLIRQLAYDYLIPKKIKLRWQIIDKLSKE